MRSTEPFNPRYCCALSKERLFRAPAACCKIRWAGRSHGKRGGIRVIYFWYVSDDAFYMLFAYAKGTQADLTPAQVKLLRGVVREEME